MELAAFPRQFARTRRFSLGVPQRFTVSPDGERVLFTRSVSGTDARILLWVYENGAERLLAGGDGDRAGAKTGAGAGIGSGSGIGSYATDRHARVAAYTRDGALWTVETVGGDTTPRRLPVPGPVTDPRPSPDGTLIAYVRDGALRVVRDDGTADRALAEPESPDVTYGLPDHTARESIGRTRAFWWSPDGTALLVARVDTSMVRRWHVGDPADPARPPRAVRYPAAGTANAETSLLLITVGGDRTPVALPRTAPEPGGAPAAPGTWRDGAFEYLLRADWDGAAPVVTVQTRDQRTVWVLRVDPSTGAVRPLSRHTDDAWVEFPPGTPLHTGSGTAVLPYIRGDAYGIRIGDVPSPAGLQVRAVLGAVGERVFFTASEEPTETHVWSYTPSATPSAGPSHGPDPRFVRLTDVPGVHTATVGGDNDNGATVVLDSRTPAAHTVTVVRGGEPAGRIAVLTERPLVTPAPVPLVLGARESRGQLHLPSWYEPGAGPLPVLLSPYAGPGMQVVNRAGAWHSVVRQWFAEHGFAVLVVDGRGTPGRGVAWQRAITGDRLTPVLDDQIDALHATAARYDGALDLTRVGIRGWSFSGYLAAGAVLRRPDVFHAAVAGAPVTDRRLYDTYWEERYLGHPDSRPEGYARSSLLPYPSDANGTGTPVRPLLLVHGLLDDNVFPLHTLRLSAALLAAGRPHSVLPLPGTGHLVAREGTADALLLRELAFFREALAAGGRPAAESAAR
ncbi:prolyl oligopeptidase family serine peptidase [Streptomyces paludis]|uniref:S9 family peptidase n=1 Tax=Streptomyces paludis TaxID=2282738 RepID=A0A345HJ97_9ACTN|nr:prolyl oligopeptidase family serine peptidase [Streptomyces paludis]AXG76771.1 S9 family peptidase [Streptomyces paludis]